MTRYHCILTILLVISPYLASGAPTTVSTLFPEKNTLSAYYCNDSPAWSGPSFFPKNCATAVTQFYVQEIIVNGDADFEFLAIGGRAQSRYPSRKLPQKFTFDTCTMAIVMLASFYPEELPGIPPSRVFTLVDVASYTDAWTAVKRVMTNCISKYLETNETMQESGGGMNFRSQTGWSAIGTKGDIGVFLWDTNSEMNRKIDALDLPGDGLQPSYAPLQLMNMTQSETVGPQDKVLSNIM